MADEKPIVGHTKHGELTLDQLAELQPGLGTLMRDVSERYWILYYAAKGGNWGLAAYELRGLRSLFKKGIMTRPKYQGMLDNFAEKIFDPLENHIAGKDFSAFEKAYIQGVELANKMHIASNHGEIIWKLPPNPPQHLDLGPQSEKK
ncbi:MAG TPA: hypothetical protein VLZ12_12445 [Verrucomicrobiae bacterium]|nr:hypothetical protein [Verrucomicrobiae bacterium]